MERIKLNIQRFANDSNTIEVELAMVVKELQSSINKANTSLNTLKGNVKGVTSETSGIKNVARQIKDAFSSINLSSIFNSIKRLGRTLYSDFLTKAIDTSEELNLFNVVFDNVEKNGKTVFSNLGKEATQFQNKLNEAFGTNKKETMRYQGLFQSMGESAGLKEEVAALMSENMTKLSYDLASLYNTTETKAAESLRAGVYAGQTKPLRNYGIDVTQTSFKPIMEGLGLEKSVNELTQAEKEVLRYIATLNQARNAMGDFANTIESPANQLKVLKQQFYEMQAAIGTLFVGAFARILPYVNAIIMVIKELAKIIAGFFGIKMKDYNTGIASSAEALDDYSAGLGGVADSAGGASNAIKELKRQTLGFDQINNLTSPTPSSGGSGGGGGAGGGLAGGIDQRLLDAIKGYDNGMDSVRMKALDIRDAIMDWLGFTKVVNSETGEVTWKLKDSNSTMTQLIQALKDIVTYGVKAIKKVFNIIKDDFDNGSFGKLFVGIFKTIAGLLKTIAENEVAAQIVAKIVEGVLLFKTVEGILSPFTKKFEKLGKAIAKVTGAKNVKEVGKMSDLTKSIKKTFNVPDAKTVLKGLADVAIIIGGMTAIVAAIGLLTKIPGFNSVMNGGIETVIKVFSGIGKIILPLAAVSAGMALLGTLGVGPIAMGLADLAIIIIGTEAVVLAAGAINKIAGDFISSGIDVIQKIFNGIAKVALPLGVMSAAFMAVGLLGGMGAAALAVGLADFAIVIVGTEAVIAAAGAISKIPGFSWLVGEGIKSLKKLFEGLGEIAGSLVKGFINVSFSGLEDIGTHLAGFMNNAKPFFDEASKINEGTTAGIKNLAAAVLILTANDVLDGLTSWFTGGSSLEKFGQDLVAFAPNFKRYADEISGIDTKVITATSTAAKSLAEFAKNVPNEGGLAALFAGENRLDVFSSYLPTFGKNMKKYGDSIKGLDTSVITSSANAAKAIVEMSKEVPNQGGMVMYFTGDNTIDVFSKYLPAFGTNMKKYSDNIKGIDAGVIKNSANAAKAIAEMAKNLPNQGGIVSWFTGDTKLSDFGADLAKFGKSFKTYYGYIKEITMSKIESATTAIKNIVTELKKIKDNKLTTTLNEFANGLNSAGGKIKSFFNNSFSNTQGFNIGYSFGANIASGIRNGIRDYLGSTIKIKDNGSTVKSFRIQANADGGVFANGAWQPIQAYANGGVPTGGQLFMAREAGPELVGRIGRHTAVMNNNQIVDSVKAGVYEAVSAAMSNGGMGSVQIDLHTDEGVVVDRINKITRQTGVCPIDI